MVFWVILCGFFPLGMAQDTPPAGPAYQSFDLTLETGTRTEIVGPFYYFQKSETDLTEAWPPFYSRYTDTNVANQEVDILYPLLTRETYGPESRWQFLQLFSFAGGVDPAAGNTDQARRFTIYPIYFQQRSANTNDDYTAVLPFYGHIKNRLMFNDVTFVMFPFYSESKKKDVVTDNYVYPFFHLRQGDHLNGWQFWPLYGQEHTDITTLTNGFGDISLNPGHNNNTEGIGTTNPVSSLGVIPLYAQQRSPARDSTTVIWPLFSWIDNREKQYHEWQGPWPFVIYTRGAGKHTSRVWPLFSESHDLKHESDSYLWPLYQFRGYHTEMLTQAHTSVLFYIYQEEEEKNLVTGINHKRVDMWPFFTWHRDAVGNERLQILAPVEPALADRRGIERNWSPLWSLWRAENNGTNGAQSLSLLWNLYRSDRTPASKKVSLLFGLFQYRQEGGTNNYRCFYCPALSWSKQAKQSGQ